MDMVQTSNNTKHSQEKARIEEQFHTMSKKDAEKISFRTRMPPEDFARYKARIEELQSATEEMVTVVETSNWKETRKNLLLVAKKLGVKLSTLKTLDGLHFWLASPAEVVARKKTKKK